MTITGRFEKDGNFTTVYADNRIYTIARNTGDWSFVTVGEYIGPLHLTQDWYDKHANACKYAGVFTLA